MSRIPPSRGAVVRPGRPIGVILLLAALAAALPTHGSAQDPVPGPGALPPDTATAAGAPGTDAVGDRYTVHLLTMEQGDEVWELFGHNAILIRDTALGRDLVWNWGLFNFGDVDFIPRLVRGAMLYSMGPSELGPFLEAYRRANRTVYANEIRLSEEEARELDEFVRWNYLPDNRDYVYDYYRDNCSTRVRDALDLVLDGALREHFAEVLTPQSYRWHSRRLVRRTGWVDQGLSLLLGSPTDRPISEWEAMFLPMRMMELLEGFERSLPEGGTTPLLGPREVLYQADRPAAPTAPAPLSPLWPLLGILGALAVGTLATLASRRGWARVGLWGAVVAWGSFSGVFGLLMVLFWFTDHVFAHWNVNLFYTSPLGLPLAAVGAVALLRKGRLGGGAGRFAAGTAVLVAAGALAMALVEATPFVTQGNAEVVALALPMNLAVAWGLLQRSGPDVVPGREPPGADPQQ